MGSPGDDGRRYRIVRRLGHGGMAEVFEAVMSGSHGFTRRVAIKRITTRAADDPEMAERFLDEARIASQLHHAGIVGVLDYGFVDGLPFQVLEFVDGLDADRLIDRAGGKLPVDISLILAADVAHALDHAHRAVDADGLRLGIVHRDVKPANVLVSWDGDVKLSDFGIAMARDRVAITEAGVARGTPWFMAPEQRTKTETSPRTDVFALGCTLHAMLTGASPLVDFEVAMRVISGDPAPLDPSVPDDVLRVITRAVAPAPEARYADCGALADALGRVLAARLDRDARGRLRDYLTGLRKPATAGAGLLDQLLGVDLVLAGNASGGRAEAETREFTLRATQPGPSVPGGPPAVPPELVVALAPAPPAAPVADRRSVEIGAESTTAPIADGPRGRRVGLWLAGLVIVAGASVGIGVAVTRSGATARSDAALTPVAAIDAATAVANLPIDAAPAVAAADATPAVAAVIDARPDRRHGDARVVVGRVDGAVPPPASDATGYVVISGAGLVRADILIDGRHAGYAPNPIEVRVGRHKLEVVKQDGGRLGPNTIDVTPYHTVTKPLRPSL